MNLTTENGMKFVISFRVNRKEKEALELLAERSGHSISSLIRTNLDMLESEAKSLNLLTS